MCYNMHIMKKRNNAPKTKKQRQIVSVKGKQLSTALASLSLVFLIIGGFAVTGLFTAFASAGVTSNSIEEPTSNAPTSIAQIPAITSSSSVPEAIVEPEPEPEPIQVVIDTLEILQNPELPNGCEITSLAAALATAGYMVDNTTLADEYLPRSESYWGADPEKVYMGNPRLSSANSGNSSAQGWYCYEGPILEAANNYLADQESLMTAVAENLDRESFMDKLKSGTPVISWVTTDMTAPTHSSVVGWNDENGEWFVPYINLHCVLVIGYNLEVNELGLMDPLVGFRTVDTDTFFSVYEMMGSRSVTIEYK